MNLELRDFLTDGQDFDLLALLRVCSREPIVEMADHPPKGRVGYRFTVGGFTAMTAILIAAGRLEVTPDLWQAVRAAESRRPAYPKLIAAARAHIDDLHTLPLKSPSVMPGINVEELITLLAMFVIECEWFSGPRLVERPDLPPTAA